MSGRTWTATLLDGRTVTVHLPKELTFTGPGEHTPEAKRHAVIYAIAKELAPKLGHGTPPERRLERDASGNISRIVEVPAYSAEHIAADIGRRVADVILAEPES